MNVIICCCRSVYECKLIPVFFFLTLCEQRREKWNKYCLCLGTENSAFECWVLHDYKRSGDKVRSQVQTGKLALVVVLMYDTPVFFEDLLNLHSFTYYSSSGGEAVLQKEHSKNTFVCPLQGWNVNALFASHCREISATGMWCQLKVNTDVLRNFIYLKKY